MVNLSDRVGSLEGAHQKLLEQLEGMQYGMERMKVELQRIQKWRKIWQSFQCNTLS